MAEVLDKFAEKGITFRVVQKEDAEKIWQMVTDNFFPFEPLSRSLGLNRNQTMVDKIGRQDFRETYITSCLKQQHSLMALDKDGDIVGVKMARTARKADKRVDPPSLSWLNYFLWMLPAQWSKVLALQGMFEKIKSNPWTIMEETGSDKICISELLCTSSKARGLGLGSELARRSLELAREDGCTGYMAIVTGIYSQKIYHDLGFDELYRVEYSEEKDKYGKVVIDDRLEHTHIENTYRSL